MPALTPAAPKGAIMPWRFAEDGVTSDLTVVATAEDRDALFTAAADAVTTAMVENAATAVARHVTLPITLAAPTLDLLLLRFLDELVFHKDARGLVLRASRVHVEGDDRQGFTLRAELAGEPIDPDKHVLGADVKAATLYGLRVEPCAGGWEAQVTLDV
jgi:SHS2 domain-containing protein